MVGDFRGRWSVDIRIVSGDRHHRLDESGQARDSRSSANRHVGHGKQTNRGFARGLRQSRSARHARVDPSPCRHLRPREPVQTAPSSPASNLPVRQTPTNLSARFLHNNQLDADGQNPSQDSSSLHDDKKFHYRNSCGNVGCFDPRHYVFACRHKHDTAQSC